jgi:hypothetical protein
MTRTKKLEPVSNEDNPAMNTQPLDPPQPTIMINHSSAATLADDIAHLLDGGEAESVEESRVRLAGFVETLRELVALDAMANVPTQGFYFVQ